jgi:phosphotriesterase-related protein
LSTVNTVMGPVEPADLGTTLMHEHVFVLTDEVQNNYQTDWGSESQRIAEAVTELQRAYDAGVRTIVDPTVVGLGRYIPRIQEIARQVPLQIVVATGVYTYANVPNYFMHRPPQRNAPQTDPMVEMFIGDIREGINGTGVKAGMLKCAIDRQGLTRGVERVMRAVAQTHLATDVPITVHTHPGSQTGLHVKRVMVDEEGVDPSRIVLGHSGDSTDCDHLSALADMGFTLGMDRFGINRETTFEARADTLVEMVRRGYADRMVLSQDASCYIDWMDPATRAQMTQWHFTHVFDDVIPYALEHGVEQSAVDTMLVAVPRRVLAGD